MPKFSAYMKGGDGIVGPPGASFISGIVATTSQLPENPPENRRIYLVGESDPKHIYTYIDGVWTDQGSTASEVARVDATIESIGWTEDPTVQVSFSTQDQKDYFNFDFAVPKTRPAGFGTSSDASATTIAFGATPTVSVSTNGEDWEKNFHFDFNIPAGEPAGFGTPHVEVEKVPSGTDPIVEISTVTTSPENAKEFNFHFGIPEGVAAGFSTNQNVSVSTLDTGELATVEISTVTTSPETEKVFNFHFGLPRGDALAIYDGIPFTANADGYNYHWEDRNGTSTLVFDRGTVEKVPIYIYNNNNESIASTFKLSTSTIEYEADEKFDGTMYLMMPATLQSVEVGSVSSTTFGNQPVVSKSTSSTSTTLILDFVIPEGYPGHNVIDSMTTNIESLSTNKVSKNGDTITGKLIVQNSDLDILNPYMDTSAASVGSSIFETIGFKDKDGRYASYIQVIETATEGMNGRMRMALGARRCNVNNNNAEVTNGFEMYVNTDGTVGTYFTSPGAWRDGLSAVYKGGDTMTGNLKVSKSNASGDVGFIAEATNVSNTMFFGVGGSGAAGIWSYKTSQWILAVASDGSLYFNGLNFSNAASIRSSIGLGSVATESTVPISKGGTGATDAINARKNLGYLGMFFAPSVNTTECIIIPNGSDLNTATFTACGKYVSQNSADAATLVNCPIQLGFQMLVFNMVNSNAGVLGPSRWDYRVRIIMTYTGEIFTQWCDCNSQYVVGFQAWKKVTMTTV